MAKIDIPNILNGGGIEAWNEFRRQTSSQVSLSGTLFDGYNLDRGDFISCDLTNAEFSDCSLRHADFNKATLIGARFYKCDLIGIQFSAADLQGASFYNCDLTDADFSHASGLQSRQFDECIGLETARVPEYLVLDYDENDYTDEDISPEDDGGDRSTQRFIEDDFDGDTRFVEIDGKPRELPRVPRRVPAPVETDWIDEKLVVVFETNESLISYPVIQAHITSFKIEITEFSGELRKTNIDNRVIERLERSASEFPVNADDFSQKIFRVWHRFRPIFEYSKIVEAEEAEYIRARFIALESDLRGILNSFPIWRSYEYEASRLGMPAEFDIDRLVATKEELISSLQKFPENIDSSVTDSLREIKLAYFGGSSYARSSVYDYAATFTNVLSRIMRKIIAEIVAGGSEGVREGTKKLVTGIMIDGGATMVWLIAKGLGVFPWLTEAWSFVRRALGL